ncbi:MAG: M15 family metallopeptidase [Marmoricola sp.]
MTRSPGRLRLPVVGTLLVLLLLAACGGEEAAAPAPRPTTAATTPPPTPAPTPTPSQPAPPTTEAPPAPGSTPPPWLGRRVLPEQANGFGEVRPTPPALDPRRFTLPDQLPPLPGDGFAFRVASPAPADVIARSTWKPGCPVRADELAWVRLTFAGFDDRRHTGELLVNRSVADDLVEVFRRLYAARFPIEEMRITRADELDAPPTGDGNNTGAFACRPTTGGTSYSQHAYGLAIDVNPFQNPYEKGDVVLPELASSYLDRERVRPGMIGADGPVRRAFAAIGWPWGGVWSSLKDYQHFSQNGR